MCSTREIKPNQTDIGRKVKVKTSINRLSNIPTNNATLNKRDFSSSSNYVDSSINLNSLNNTSSNINHNSNLINNNSINSNHNDNQVSSTR